MKEKYEDKSLAKINKNSIFNKIRLFFRNIFKSTSKKINLSIDEGINESKINDVRKSDFFESIKNISDEETELLALQRKYESGEKNNNQLSNEQIKSLIKLYKKQIKELNSSNELRKQRIQNLLNNK